MQKAEQEMAMYWKRTGAPVVGTYADPEDNDVVRALDIARQQWESGEIKEDPVNSEDHKLGDAGLKYFCEHPLLNKTSLTELYLKD